MMSLGDGHLMGERQSVFWCVHSEEQVLQCDDILGTYFAFYFYFLVSSWDILG
jgi:hypothetical protein